MQRYIEENVHRKKNGFDEKIATLKMLAPTARSIKIECNVLWSNEISHEQESRVMM